MIYLIAGENYEERKKVLSGLKKKHSFDVLNFGVSDFDYNNVSNIAMSDGLFDDKYFIIFQDVLKNEDILNFYSENLESMRGSESFFCFVEEKVLKPLEKKLKLEDSEFYKTQKVEKKTPSFNLFSLTDSLASGDKKNLWVLYQKALLAGVSPEEVVPILLWQLKTSVLALRSKTASEAGLKPFVYGKSKNGSLEVVSKRYEDLLSIYHDARRGKNLKDGLEKFILSL